MRAQLCRPRVRVERCFTAASSESPVLSPASRYTPATPMKFTGGFAICPRECPLLPCWSPIAATLNGCPRRLPACALIMQSSYFRPWPRQAAGKTTGSQSVSFYITQGLHRAMQRHPEKLATIYGKPQRGYGQYAERVVRFAAALQKLGTARGDRVGMLALNTDRYREFHSGTGWGGGAVNPVNIRCSADRILAGRLRYANSVGGCTLQGLSG